MIGYEQRQIADLQVRIAGLELQVAGLRAETRRLRSKLKVIEQAKPRPRPMITHGH